MKRTILNQGNQSMIKKLENRIKSAGKHSRHINIRYFWVTDRIKNEDIMLEYCPTEKCLPFSLQSHYKEACSKQCEI